MKPVIFILGPSALPLAEKLAAAFDGTLVGPKADIADLQMLFQEARPIFALCAAGIVMRALGPLLYDKTEEPPVLALAEDGTSIIPLLGGHRGANQWARRIAALTGGHAAITTASDLRFGASFDEPPTGHVMGNPEHMKAASAARLRGEAVELIVTEEPLAGSDRKIIHHPVVLTVGIGCERGTSPQEVQDLIAATLAGHSLSPHSIALHASIDLKEDEPAVFSLPAIRFFTVEELRAETARLQNPSSLVEAEVGVAGVAEAAALAAAGPAASLVVPKVKSARATCAIARSPSPILTLPGRPRGQLHIVGLGPGNAAHRSPAVTRVLLRATDWVGYGLYLDLAADLRHGKQQHPFALGDEEARCRHAIALATAGKTVALLCSGDAAIYAMAALVYELIDREPCRIGIEVHPGISAFQMASARAGAMIGHDFCCISLSDLLTPWPIIERRIQAAAKGDFVTAFYNPRSLKRRDQIEQAFRLLAPHRKAETPVVIAANLGRADEKVRTIAFADFNAGEIDMLTIVLVGSSQSRLITRGDGKNSAYTPRGYAKKMNS